VGYSSNCARGVYNANFRDEVAIIVVFTGWLLADVLSPDTLHVTVSTRLHQRLFCMVGTILRYAYRWSLLYNVLAVIQDYYCVLCLITL
jgi:hypothetical protein